MGAAAVLPTDAGMHVVWDRDHFASVHDYDTWSPELEDDDAIARHIASAHLVPINLHHDAAFAFDLRVDEDAPIELSPEEELRVVVRSEPYRLQALGHVDVSGIEYVHREPEPGRVLSTAIRPGIYDVQVHLMDYDDVPTRGLEHPDLIITVGPARVAQPRSSIETFVRPNA